MVAEIRFLLLTGDGELQEGPIWEAVIFAGQKHLDNLCVMVDRNSGQLDIANRMVFPMSELEAVFSSFDWEVHSVDATHYDGVLAALEKFRRSSQWQADRDHLARHERPWSLVGLSHKHKVTVPDKLLEQEIALQTAQRRCPFFDRKVMWRIAVGHQERLEAAAGPDGWLSEDTASISRC